MTTVHTTDHVVSRLIAFYEGDCNYETNDCLRQDLLECIQSSPEVAFEIIFKLVLSYTNRMNQLCEQHQLH